MSEAAKTREVVDGVVEVFLPLPAKPTIVNVYLVRAGADWTLVDTGMNTLESEAAFRGALAALAIPPRAIRRIIGTHHHVDHYGSSTPYRELTGAEVFLHPLEAERASATLHASGDGLTQLLRRAGAPAPPPGHELPPPSQYLGSLYLPAVPDHPLRDGDDIPLGDGRVLKVVWTPGHTPGHCCLLLEPDGILFVGDHLLPKITPHVGLFPTGPENPLGDFLASQEKIQGVEARLVCPAHGAVFEDHRRRARQVIDFHRVRKLSMLDLLRRRPLTAYEVAIDHFAIPADNLFQILMATSETLAHLELLRREGRVVRSERDGIVHYQAH